MTSSENRLIELLPSKDQIHLLAQCEQITLKASRTLDEPAARSRNVYFPLSSCISLVSTVGGAPGVAVAMVGCEGMVGAHLALNLVVSPWRATVQEPGASWRISVAAFRQELQHSLPLRKMQYRYLYYLVTQLANAAFCQRFHDVRQRLSRHLLMSQDRASPGAIQQTQAGIAHALGVRRVSVSQAAALLQHDGVIDYRRGAICVLQRDKLEAAACTCYRHAQTSYQDTMEHPARSPAAPA